MFGEDNWIKTLWVQNRLEKYCGPLKSFWVSRGYQWGKIKLHIKATKLHHPQLNMTSGEISRQTSKYNNIHPFQQTTSSSHLPPTLIYFNLTHPEYHQTRRANYPLSKILIQDTELMPTSMTTQPGFSHDPPQGSRWSFKRWADSRTVDPTYKFCLPNCNHNLSLLLVCTRLRKASHLISPSNNISIAQMLLNIRCLRVTSSDCSVHRQEHLGHWHTIEIWPQDRHSSVHFFPLKSLDIPTWSKRHFPKIPPAQNCCCLSSHCHSTSL